MKKHERILEFARQFEGQGIDPRYAGYFALFNAQKFYEAHDVLEDLWLADKRGPDGDFYKGLIQLAGAFVHLQKNRPGPSAALFKLVQGNLRKYSATHNRLSVTEVFDLTMLWLRRLEFKNETGNLLDAFPPPTLHLIEV